MYAKWKHNSDFRFDINGLHQCRHNEFIFSTFLENVIANPFSQYGRNYAGTYLIINDGQAWN